MLPQSNRVLLCGALLAALFRHVIYLQPQACRQSCSMTSLDTSSPQTHEVIGALADVMKCVCSGSERSFCKQVVNRTSPSLRVGCAPCFSAGHQATIRPCPAHIRQTCLALHDLIATMCLAGNPLPSGLSGMHMYLPGYPSPPYPRCSRRGMHATCRSLACSAPATQRNDVCCLRAIHGPT